MRGERSRAWRGWGVALAMWGVGLGSAPVQAQGGPSLPGGTPSTSSAMFGPPVQALPGTSSFAGPPWGSPSLPGLKLPLILTARGSAGEARLRALRGPGGGQLGDLPTLGAAPGDTGADSLRLSGVLAQRKPTRRERPVRKIPPSDVASRTNAKHSGSSRVRTVR